MGNLLWYVIRTKPKQEYRADSNLNAWGVEVFSPRIKERARKPFTGAPIEVAKFLFPRYIFARFDSEIFLHKICYTRGVHSVVSFGGIPVHITDETIWLIKSRIGLDGFVYIAEHFKAGDRVEVKEGPFKSFTGIFERELKDSERVSILLDTVSYQASVMLEKEMIKKISSNSVPVTSKNLNRKKARKSVA